MGILREYVCAAHGPFESDEPECPYGCSPRFVAQEIRTAPALRSYGTGRTDQELRNLATDYRLSDIRNGADGDSVMTTLRKNPSFAPSWGQVDHAQPGFSTRGDVKTFKPESAGVSPDNVISRVKPMLTGPRPNYINKPGS